MNIGKAIKVCRTQRGLTQKELAYKAGLSIVRLSMIERNIRWQTFPTLERVAAALDVPMLILIFMASDNHDIDNLNTTLVDELSLEAIWVLQNQPKPQ